MIGGKWLACLDHLSGSIKPGDWKMEWIQDPGAHRLLERVRCCSQAEANQQAGQTMFGLQKKELEKFTKIEIAQERIKQCRPGSVFGSGVIPHNSGPRASKVLTRAICTYTWLRSYRDGITRACAVPVSPGKNILLATFLHHHGEPGSHTCESATLCPADRKRFKSRQRLCLTYPSILTAWTRKGASF